jgi:hypothetical protein
VRRCRSTSRRDLAGDEGNDHDRALGTWGRTRARSGRHGERDRGHNAGAGAPEGLWANREVSGAADDEVELTEAADMAGAQRRSQNGGETTASGGGTFRACTDQERARGRSAGGATGQGE